MSARFGGLLSRLVTAFVVLPLLLALIWVPQARIGFVVFVSFIAAVGLLEYYRLVRTKGIDAVYWIGIGAGTAVVVSAGFTTVADVNAAFLLAIVVVLSAHVLQEDTSIAAMSASTFGIAYVGWFPAHLVLLHDIETTGAGLVTFLVIVVVLTDTGAYFVGKNFGKRKLAPIISPNKTWEGAVGGWVVGVAIAVGAVALVRVLDWQVFPEWPLVRVAYTAALISIASQIGDLVESALKRDAGVKDAGGLFPGHGGALDRCDGFLFASPVLYYMAAL